MSAATMMTSRERAAAQAYVRLLGAVRAALAEPSGAAPPPLALTAPMAEADRALADAGFAGNEAELFGLVRDLHTAGVTRRAAGA
ncbi:hypothetical protein ACWGI8_37625 [Streptomyces sp. NPDC054841]